MKLKPFQKQDLARAALHDGLILSWDTGLGKTWALFLWALIKVGYIKLTKSGKVRICPKAAVLIIAPGDLHKQIASEGLEHFKVDVTVLDSQETFERLLKRDARGLPIRSDDGRLLLEPGFYITSYTQLATNGVHKAPDVDKWDDPTALRDWLCLSESATAEFFRTRETIWKDEYHRLHVDPDGTFKDLERAYERERGIVERSYLPPKQKQKQLDELDGCFGILKNLFTHKPKPTYDSLNALQQQWVTREHLRRYVEECAENVGEVKAYPIGERAAELHSAVGCADTGLPSATRQHVTRHVDEDTRPKWQVKCVYSPSLSDLCYDAFDATVIDEGVKMKGEETLVGRGVRQMASKYRLVLTATPVKNRLPDIFRLAWWAAGGQLEAHARWPYRDDPSEREEFARTFLVSERNVSKEEQALREGRVVGGRYKKLTAEVCNVHRLWKLLAPIVLRRRKADCGVDIVQKIRKVIRCEMGTEQLRVYKYHIDAPYVDKNGRPAIGAQLQALRVAAADPASELLEGQGGTPMERCPACNSSKFDVQSLMSDGTSNLKPRTSNCPRCDGKRFVPLPYRGSNPFIPKMAVTLELVKEILERKEQVLIGSAFNGPLDNLAGWLREAGVRHVLLDGRTSQKRRGEKAAAFKMGRNVLPSCTRQSSRKSAECNSAALPTPVMLAGVECMAEGHSFHRANNVILIAYSWAYDKFKQFFDRVHRMISEKDVNVYVVIANGSIDRKLESLVQEKSDSQELVLDGRLIGERSEEVNLAELLEVARREFDAQTNTIDESALQRGWPKLCAELSQAMREWDNGLVDEGMNGLMQPSRNPLIQQSACKIINLEPEPDNIIELPVAANGDAVERIPTAELPETLADSWKERMRARALRLKAATNSNNLWAQL